MNNILIFGMTENPGGVESFLMSYIRKINRGNFKFDFLCNSHDKIAYEDELISYGCEIYHITARSKDYKKYKREMQQFFKENASQYDTIWVNVCSLANIDYLKYAKKYGIKRRIIHSHNSMNMDSKLRGLLHAYNKRHIDKYATDFWACSKEAGEWFYSKQIMQGANYKEIKNAIDISQYKYDEDIRIAYRKKYGVEDKFVIGNVGRLQFQKNQLFLLDIFASVLKKKPEAILWMIGHRLGDPFGLLLEGHRGVERAVGIRVSGIFGRFVGRSPPGSRPFPATCRSVSGRPFRSRPPSPRPAVCRSVFSCFSTINRSTYCTRPDCISKSG